MMRMPTLVSVALGLLVLAGLAPAQETPRTTPEQEKPRTPEVVAPPTPEVAAPAAPCGPECAPRPGVKVLWVEREVPIQRLVPREVITLVPTTTVEVAYREEKRVFTEMVLQPREVERPMTVSVIKPVTVTCPTTGQCSTVMQPCTEVKMVKQTEFVAVPVKRELIEKVPFLRTVQAEIPQKTLILEYKTEMRKLPGAVAVPSGPEVLPRRVLLAPQPPCDAGPVAAPATEVPPQPEPAGERPPR